MGIKEGALALADELEAFEDGDCEECSLYGQPECKGHLSCMEIMARYAARKMREAVERDAEDVTTVSAYDLLPDDDREALAWVREHGGLESVKKLLDWVVGHCSTKQQLDFDFWLSGRVMYELGFEEDMADRDEVERRRREAERKKRALAALAKIDGFEIIGGVALYDPETGRTY